MSFTNQELSNILFTKQDTGSYKCAICKKFDAKGNGWTNLGGHARRHREMLANRNFEGPVLSKVALDMYQWVDWVISGNHSLAFVDCPKTRKNAVMESICSDTLKPYMQKIYTSVRPKIADLLPGNLESASTAERWATLCGDHRSVP